MFSSRSVVWPGHTKLIGLRMDGEILTKTVGAKAGPAEDKQKTASRVIFRTAVSERLWQPICTNIAMNYDFAAYV